MDEPHRLLTSRAVIVPAPWGVVRLLISHIPPFQTFSWFTKKGELGFRLLVRRHETHGMFRKRGKEGFFFCTIHVGG